MTNDFEFIKESIQGALINGEELLGALDNLHFLHGITTGDLNESITKLMRDFRNSQKRKERDNLQRAYRKMLRSEPFNKYDRKALDDFREFLIMEASE